MIGSITKWPKYARFEWLTKTKHSMVRHIGLQEHPWDFFPTLVGGEVDHGHTKVN